MCHPYVWVSLIMYRRKILYEYIPCASVILQVTNTFSLPLKEMSQPVSTPSVPSIMHGHALVLSLRHISEAPRQLLLFLLHGASRQSGTRPASSHRRVPESGYTYLANMIISRGISRSCVPFKFDVKHWNLYWETGSWTPNFSSSMEVNDKLLNM